MGFYLEELMVKLIKGAVIGFFMSLVFIFLSLLAHTNFLWRYMELSESLHVCFGAVPALVFGAFQFQKNRLLSIGLLCGTALAGAVWFSFFNNFLISLSEWAGF